jgi:hypothetical protein
MNNNFRRSVPVKDELDCALYLRTRGMWWLEAEMGLGMIVPARPGPLVTCAASCLDF